MEFAEWEDGSILEAASWRLASEVCRRHPTTTRLIRAHPGGGQSDCLWMLPAAGEHGDVRLNRNGTIQVLGRFDGQRPTWGPTAWDVYLRSDPHRFLVELEAASGLLAPRAVPSSSPRTLTLRVLAALAATAVKSVQSVEIEPGFIDTSGGGGGANGPRFAAFPAIPERLRAVREDDLHGVAEYRFWFVARAGEPVLAFEQGAGLAWTRHATSAAKVMELYAAANRRVDATALELLRRVEQG